jgi:hypothetical protein
MLFVCHQASECVFFVTTVRALRLVYYHLVLLFRRFLAGSSCTFVSFMGQVIFHHRSMEKLGQVS